MIHMHVIVNSSSKWLIFSQLNLFSVVQLCCNHTRNCIWLNATWHLRISRLNSSKPQTETLWKEKSKMIKKKGVHSPLAQLEVKAWFLYQQEVFYWTIAASQDSDVTLIKGASCIVIYFCGTTNELLHNWIARAYLYDNACMFSILCMIFKTLWFVLLRGNLIVLHTPLLGYQDFMLVTICLILHQPVLNVWSLMKWSMWCVKKHMNQYWVLHTRRYYLYDV